MWIYKVVEHAMSENQLNLMGKSRWELVAVTLDPENGAPTYYFKRNVLK